MLDGNEYEKLEVRSRVESLGSDVGTEVGPCDGITVGKISGKL